MHPINMTPTIRIRDVGQSWFWEVFDAQTGTLLVWAQKLHRDRGDALVEAEDAWFPLLDKAQGRG
jgi:hypothetical protein